MKKYILLIVLFATCFFKGQASFEYLYEGKLLIFEVLNSSNLTCELIGASTDDMNGTLIVPETAINQGKEYKVTSIKSQAFESKNWSTVVIGDNIISIGSKAFYSNRQLTELNLGNSVQTIGENAFGYCGFNELIIPGSVTTINDMAFVGTPVSQLYFQKANSENGKNPVINITTPFDNTIEYLSLGRDLEGNYFKYAPETSKKLIDLVVRESVNYIQDRSFQAWKLNSVTIEPGNLKSIGVSAFENCKELRSISLPDNIQTLGMSAFLWCSNLADVKLSSNLTVIPQNAFYGCENLTSITLPNSITSIGMSAFQDCKALPTINLPSGLKEITNLTFSGCSKLNNISLPESVTSIGASAFINCTSLSQIGLSNIKTLGINSFQGCSSLQKVVFGDELTTIPDYCFDGCSALLDVQLPDGITSIGKNAFNDNNVLSTVKLPAQLTLIDSNAFSGCNALTEISFPDKVKNINLNAFAGCDNITTVYSLNHFAPTCQSKSVFSDETYNKATLYAPTGYLESYKTSIGWKEFYTKEGLTEVSKVEISNAEGKNRVRVQQTLQLSANITPANATMSTVKWSSNNPAVAKVSNDGTVTGVSVGYAVITATATDYTALTGTFEVQVIDFLLGDSNMSDYVTVTDAVNIASYLLDKNPVPFSFEASDVNGDEVISIGDASGVISIILDGDMTTSYALTRSNGDMTDKLIAGDMLFNATGKATVPVALVSNQNLVALQADILITEGMTINDIIPSEALNSTHSLTMKIYADNAARLIIYSPQMNLLQESGTLFSLIVEGGKEKEGSVIMTNILASTNELNEIELGYEGGNSTPEFAKVDFISNDEIIIFAQNKEIVIKNAAGHSVEILNLNGLRIKSVECANNEEHITLESGLYLVKAGNSKVKVFVK